MKHIPSFQSCHMAEMSFLSNEVLVGKPKSQDYLEVAKHFKPHGFSSNKAKVGSSEWLAEDSFSRADWMVEKRDVKGFDFDSLFSMDDLEAMPDELSATLDDTCDLFDPLTVNPIGHLPESSPKTDQIVHFAFFTLLQPLPLSPGALSSTPNHSFSLEIGSEVTISGGDRKSDSTAYITMIPQCIKEEDAPSDNDTGICMSPESYFGFPQHSPSTSRGSSIRSLLSPGSLCGSARPKPYDPPAAAKVKVEKLDKKLKEMEQNNTAATRYRQKKRAEQETLNDKRKEQEKKHEALKERTDSLAKEIQYLNDLIEEV
ncbi:unnamed protein product [Nyctereutes procyonoides]|uniref:Cyclic AMP-dependent transcription factor ATF-4 n=1 Tax=Nyctereutes procyonoides TaxID=34880 RepID=A0A811Y8J1_NYCPR|nr:unnamed protein product [Nyctereutes procyonoides]